MAVNRSENVRPIGNSKCAPKQVVFHATMAATGKLTVTAASIGLKNIRYLVGTADNATSGVGEIAYTTTDLSSPATSVDLEVITDASALVNAGQATFVAYGDVN